MHKSDSANSTETSDLVLNFWNERAQKGANAGTDDFLLKKLEIEEAMRRVPIGADVLDVGCGNGGTLIRLAIERKCSGTGIDYAEKLLDLARSGAAEEGVDNIVTFQKGTIPGLNATLPEFSVVISQRCIINLLDTELQVRAFEEMREKVAPGGCLLMFENSVQGLAENNSLRLSLGLELMTAPWHNLYLDEDFVARWATAEFQIEELVHFSSTYHFLSRVVYAKLAQDAGETLRYDSAINLLSCRLPPIGKFGPTKLWVWRKSK